jgi:hypothetical protein
MRLAVLLLAAAGCSGGGPHVGPPWLADGRVFVQGVGVTNQDCRNGICQHNENTDLTSWNGALWLVHRTAKSQILGPNSALHIYRSTDGGRHFTETARIDAPTDRDLRDPCFYQVGGQLYLKGLTRLPVLSEHDSNVDTITVAYRTSDGTNWDSLGQIAPDTWSFWRVHEFSGAWYSAAYQDGDLSIKLFSSADGMTWTAGADLYTVAADSPVETELVLLPSGAMMALVRADSTGPTAEVLGDSGTLHTYVCWAQPPYSSFSCPGAIVDQRLDGPIAFFWKSRLFVVGRKHLQPSDRKRTALYELSGFDAGAVPAIKEWGEIPSAGDTAYAGVVPVDDHRVLVSWYSSDVVDDENWTIGMLDATDIWLGTIDLSALR